MKLSARIDSKFSVWDFLVNNSIYLGIVVVLIITIVLEPLFLRALPLNLLYRTAAYVIMALGMGFIMQIGGADLSAGRIMGFMSLIAAAVLQTPDTMKKIPFIPILPIFVAFIIILILGAGIGCINGFFVRKLRVNPFIVTLCVQLILYGLILVFVGMQPNQGMSISFIDPEYKNLIAGSSVTDFIKAPFDIPNFVWYSIITVIIVWLIWNHTSFGKKLRLYGENHEAAETLMINPLWITIGAFAIAGALYGLNGFIEAARVGGPGINAGSGAELDAIAACLIGGASLSGGKGKVGGIVLGVIAFQLLLICLQWLLVSANLVYIIKGVVVLWAAVIDARKYC